MAADNTDKTDELTCPECGSSETGYFCRSCGTLLQGDEMMLCPRCSDVVPAGDYCNRCGQSLAGVALRLSQLALAGEDFMVATPTAPSTPAPPSTDEEVFSLLPDESVELEDAELPDWLEELPAVAAPAEVRERIYPSLQPVESEQVGSGQSRFLAVVVVLLVLMLVSLVGLALLLLFQGGA